MEATSLLTLILLSSVGARNIPAIMDQPSELPPVFDDLPSYTKTPLAIIFPTGELVESVVYVGYNLNQNSDEDEKAEDHVYNVVNMDTDINMNNQKGSKNNQEEEINSALRHVEAIEGQNNKKNEDALLEDRNALEAGCPPGTYRVGDQCWKEQ